MADQAERYANRDLRWSKGKSREERAMDGRGGEEKPRIKSQKLKMVARKTVD